jgi:hypothetical protein
MSYPNPIHKLDTEFSRNFDGSQDYKSFKHPVKMQVHVSYPVPLSSYYETGG